MSSRSRCGMSWNDFIAASVLASLVRPQNALPLGFLMNARSQARLPWPGVIIGPLRSMLSGSWQFLHFAAYSARPRAIGAVRNTSAPPLAGAQARARERRAGERRGRRVPDRADGAGPRADQLVVARVDDQRRDGQ